MRLGVVWVPSANANYRAIEPMKAMLRRGHEVVWPDVGPGVEGDDEGRADLPRLGGCDVVHVYRRSDQYTLPVLAQLARQGKPITFDNDDNLAAVPKESPMYKHVGGLSARRAWAATVKVARMARVLTTPNETLAQMYRRAGVERVELIGNYLAPDAARGRRDHDGIVIGWIAGYEHLADVARIPIADTLRRLLAKHEHVRVECIGVKLALPERYGHDAHVDFVELPGRMGAWDIGIAPLADIPYNTTRSDIKVKEYAASGVPWLASPVGPYVGLGEEQGGRLVTDDGWFEALDELVTSERERRRLSANAEAWARTQTIDAVADHWEQVFAQAAGVDTTPTRPKGAPAAPGRQGRMVVRLRLPDR